MNFDSLWKNYGSMDKTMVLWEKKNYGTVEKKPGTLPRSMELRSHGRLPKAMKL